MSLHHLTPNLRQTIYNSLYVIVVKRNLLLQESLVDVSNHNKIKNLFMQKLLSRQRQDEFLLDWPHLLKI